MRHAVTVVLAAALVGVAAFSCTALWPDALPSAAADELVAPQAGLPAALKGDTEIEQLTDAYHEAQAKVAAVDAEIANLQQQIDALMAVLPAQQARSDAGMRQRYIMLSNPLSLVESLLASQTLGDFLRQTEYLDRITRANLEEYNRTCDMKRSIDNAKAEQLRLRDEADESLAQAREALEAEQDARATRQASAIGSAQAEGDAGGLADGADWHQDRDEFIAEWTDRINAYLAGSALEGQGANFAASAWKHCVDPRWSPAISNTESSKGALCIRPFNAWGWGAADEDPSGLALEWTSWEEAIEAHVSGLSDIYGYTISLSAAQTYCPPTYEDWYNHTLSEMAKI